MQHLAIIADGNRRWAKAGNKSYRSGYTHGLDAIENCCDWAIYRGVQYLTIYCFSTENWNRPPEQVDFLMGLARLYFDKKSTWYISKGISVQFSGRRDRLDADLVQTMERMETATKGGQALILTICVDYGGRDEIVRAVASGARTEEEITAYLTKSAPEPDMIVRTGGDVRLSNFLLWQSAYAELMFTDTLFPDLAEDELDRMLHEYRTRKRNYGR